MGLAEWFPAGCAALYAAAAAANFLQGQGWLAWMYLCYAAANAGQIGVALQGRS